MVLSDTNALIQLLEGVEFDEDADVLLSTADIESLYTSIPIKDALTAVGERLTHLGESRAFVRTTLAAVELVLKNNFIECNGITYQQIKGPAMDTPLTPPVCKLVHGKFGGKARGHHAFDLGASSRSLMSSTRGKAFGLQSTPCTRI